MSWQKCTAGFFEISGQSTPSYRSPGLLTPSGLSRPKSMPSLVNRDAFVAYSALGGRSTFEPSVLGAACFP